EELKKRVESVRPFGFYLRRHVFCLRQQSGGAGMIEHTGGRTEYWWRTKQGTTTVEQFDDLPNELFVDEIVACFGRTNTPASFYRTSETVRAAVKRWIQSENIERGAMFMLAFALEMDGAACSTFLTRVLRDADFSPKHPVEVIVRYCLDHHYPYQTALQRDGAIESEWGEAERKTALYFWREFLDYFAQDKAMETEQLAVLQEYSTEVADRDLRNLRALEPDSTDEELLAILGQLSMTAAAQGMQLGRKNRVQNVFSKTAQETFEFLLTAPIGGRELRECICSAAMSPQLDGAPDGSLFGRFRDEFSLFDIGRKDFYHFLYWGIPWESTDGGDYDFRGVRQCDATGRAFSPIISRKRFNQLKKNPWSIGKRDMEYACFLRFLIEHWEELPELGWEDLKKPMAQSLRRTWFGENCIDTSTDLFDYLLSLCMETVQPYFVFQLVIAMGYQNKSFYE
ncbi:MAG: hypothetical protein ACI4PQ_02870, partial [Butyricicoccaceae bacterium]